MTRLEEIDAEIEHVGNPFDPLEILADKLAALFLEYVTDGDLWSSKASGFIRSVVEQCGEKLSDDEVGELMMRVRLRRRMTGYACESR